jgi:two-component system, cell cycle response regulator DivK
MAHTLRGHGRTADPPRLIPVPPIVVRKRRRARHGRAARNGAAVTMPVVLIVDSYTDEAEMYTQYLRSRGTDVEYVRRPEEALVRVAGAPPVVIVADMVFEWSAYDGPGFVRALRQRPECRMTNFFLLSGFTRPVDRERARDAGADRFLVKPCAPDELWRHVNSAIWAHDRTMRASWNWPDDVSTESDPARLRI